MIPNTSVSYCCRRTIMKSIGRSYLVLGLLAIFGISRIVWKIGGETCLINCLFISHFCSFAIV